MTHQDYVRQLQLARQRAQGREGVWISKELRDEMARRGHLPPATTAVGPQRRTPQPSKATGAEEDYLIIADDPTPAAPHPLYGIPPEFWPENAVKLRRELEQFYGRLNQGR